MKIKNKYISCRSLLSGLIALAAIENVSAMEEVKVRTEKNATAEEPKRSPFKETRKLPQSFHERFRIKSDDKGEVTIKSDDKGEVTIKSDDKGDVTVRNSIGGEIAHLHAQKGILDANGIEGIYACAKALERQDGDSVELSLTFERPIDQKYIPFLIAHGFKIDADTWNGTLLPSDITTMIREFPGIRTSGKIGEEAPMVTATFSGIKPEIIGTLKQDFKSTKFRKDYAIQTSINEEVSPTVKYYEEMLKTFGERPPENGYPLKERMFWLNIDGTPILLNSKAGTIMIGYGGYPANTFERNWRDKGVDIFQTGKSEINAPLKTIRNPRDEFGDANPISQQLQGTGGLDQGFGVPDVKDSPQQWAVFKEGDPFIKSLTQRGKEYWTVSEGGRAFPITSTSIYSEMNDLPHSDRSIVYLFAAQDFDAAKALALGSGSTSLTETQDLGEIN